MNYKEIFEKAYISQIQKLNDLIKTQLKKHKAENREFNFVNNLLEESLRRERNSILDLENPNLKLLEETYSNFEMSYSNGHKSKVFDNELKRKFDEIKDNINIDFVDLVKSLALLYATKEMISHYSTFSYNVKDMYDLSRFEGYRNFKTFDLARLRKLGNKYLCEELYEIKNPNLNEAINRNKMLDIEKFELKKQYERKFRDLNFYKDMVNHFFDENSITHSEFIKLFIDREILNHPIKFHCETTVAASFIYSLKDSFFKRLSINYLLNNQIFHSFDNNKLTGTNLSNTKSKNHLHDFSSLSSKLLDHSL